MFKPNRLPVLFGILLILFTIPTWANPLRANPALGQSENGVARIEKWEENGKRQLVLTSWQGDEMYELRLDLPVRADRISGSYKRGARGVVFQSSSSGGHVNFLLSTLSGQELYRIAQDDEFIRSSMLGDRLVSTFDLDFLDAERERRRKGGENGEMLGMKVDGDIGLTEEYLSIPELSFLPHISRLIGQELGYTGPTYPATLPLHVMALSINGRLESSGASSSPLPIERSLDKACQAFPNANDQCYGMCGPGCTCWSWVCGDCCYHPGCALHDSYCRTWLGFAHPYCIDFWIPFFAGGGC